ncbi:MAG: LysM peptidoglycan-binding domain-containing protein [Acidimicrobiia bacterium]
MSTYNSSSWPNQYPTGRGGPNRGPRRGPSGIAPIRNLLARRLGAMVLAGAIVAPLVWAARGDRTPVSTSESGGAAALVEFDAAADTQPVAATTTVVVIQAQTITAPTTAAPTTAAPTTAAPTTAAAVVVCATKYVVQAGDSWYGLEAKTGVKASTIAGTNNTTIRSALMVGDEICLPPGAVVPSADAPPTTATSLCGDSYTVQAGDSWSRIAAKAGVKSTELAIANGKNLRSTLLPGQVICLPAGASIAVAPATTAPGVPSAKVTTRQYSRAELEQIVRDAWPDELEADAFFVVQRESNWNNLSQNSCCLGIFQLNWNSHKKWMANYGVTDRSQLLDPVVNARLALVTWQRSGGWRPWCTASWCPVS